MIERKTVEYLADLARIELGKEELEKLSLQLEQILNFIDQLNRVNTDDVSPTSQAVLHAGFLREDSLKESLPPEKVLSLAPAKKEGFFVVPKIIQ